MSVYLLWSLNAVAENYNLIAEANSLTQSKPAWINRIYDIKCSVFQITPSSYDKYPNWMFGTEILMEFVPFSISCLHKCQTMITGPWTTRTGLQRTLTSSFIFQIFSCTVCQHHARLTTIHATSAK